MLQWQMVALRIEEEVIQHEKSVPLNRLMIWIHMKLFSADRKVKTRNAEKNSSQE